MKRGRVGHPRHVPTITGTRGGKKLRRNRGSARMKLGSFGYWLFPDASRMTKDPVGLYSFTTLADADRNRSQTNRLVYAVMPITERRDGDWMLAPGLVRGTHLSISVRTIQLQFSKALFKFWWYIWGAGQRVKRPKLSRPMIDISYNAFWAHVIKIKEEASLPNDGA